MFENDADLVLCYANYENGGQHVEVLNDLLMMGCMSTHKATAGMHAHAPVFSSCIEYFTEQQGFTKWRVSLTSVLCQLETLLHPQMTANAVTRLPAITQDIPAS